MTDTMRGATLVRCETMGRRWSMFDFLRTITVCTGWKLLRLRGMSRSSSERLRSHRDRTRWPVLNCPMYRACSMRCPAAMHDGLRAERVGLRIAAMPEFELIDRREN